MTQWLPMATALRWSCATRTRWPHRADRSPGRGKWAEVSVRLPSLRDGDKVIAATAIAKGYRIATRNPGNFRHAGVPLVDPFDPGTWIAESDPDRVSALMQPR
jgi:hypothetical protein